MISSKPSILLPGRWIQCVFKKDKKYSTIQLASACISKEQRSRGESVQVYSFVPTCYIQEGIVHKLDAFYKPLIDDVKKYYIQGIPVTITENLQVGDDFIEKGIHTARLLLLCRTADIKAHGETLYCSGMYTYLIVYKLTTGKYMATL